jgi:hypothetical protein
MGQYLRLEVIEPVGREEQRHRGPSERWRGPSGDFVSVRKDLTNGDPEGASARFTRRMNGSTAGLKVRCELGNDAGAA